MKRLSIILASVLMCTAPLCAKTASQLRIYINPGHGSYTGNDRPQNTYREVNGTRVTIKPESATDTTGFYESNTNLYKGFGMLEELINAGFSFDRSKGARNLTNNIVMSRVKSGPGSGATSTTYNRNLSEIAKEAENNNFDMFLSIHSDAASANSTTNRPLGLYRGHDTPKAETGCALTYQQKSRAIITALWPHLTGIKHMSFTNTSTSYIRGDWDFYGSHSTSGLGYSGYLGVLKSGVYGGLYEGYCHTYGPARHRALNWDVDRVEGIAYARGTSEYFGVGKSGKGLIYGIVRTKSQQLSDTYYKPQSSSNDIYMPINNAKVTLKNSNGKVISEKYTDNNYNGAFVFYNLDPGTYTVSIVKTGYVTQTLSYTVSANANNYPEIFLVPGTSEDPDAIDPLLNKMVEKWNLSETAETKSSKGYDASLFRNFCYSNGKLYCVYNHSDIKVIDAQTGADLGNLPKGDVVSGGTLTLCDVKAIDGRIIACNLAASATAQELRLYCWESDDEAPVLLKGITDLRGAARLGDCMEISGSFAGDMYITFANDDNTTSRIIEFIRAGGSSWSGKAYSVTSDGSKRYATGATTRARKANGGWWIDGFSCVPTFVKLNASGVAVVDKSFDTGMNWGPSFREFDFSGNHYLAAMMFNAADGNSSNNYTGGRVRLYMDNDKNYTSAMQIAEYPAKGLGTSRNTNTTMDSQVNTDGKNFVEIWVNSTTQGMAYYSYGTVPVISNTPVISANVSSVALTCTEGDTTTATVTAQGENLKGNITAAISGNDASLFSIDKSSLSKTGGNIVVTYSPASAGEHHAVLTLSSTGAASVNIALNGTAKVFTVLDDNISEMKEVWTFSETLGNAAATGWANIATDTNILRDVEALNGKLYTANNLNNVDGCAINVVNGETGALIKQLNTTGISGGRVILGGISSIGGKLIASNSASSAQTLKVYKWNDDNSAPELWFSDSSTHGDITIGDQINTFGTLENGYILFTNASKVVRYKVTNGSVNNTPEVITLEGGSEIATNAGMADVIAMSDGKMWVTGSQSAPKLYNADGTLIGTLNMGLPSSYKSTHQGTAMVVIPLGDRTYIAATTYTDPSTTISKGALAVYDVTEAMASPSASISGRLIGVYPAAGLGTTRNTQFQTGVTYEIVNDGTKLNIWGAVCLQGVTHVSYDGAVERPHKPFLLGDTNGDGSITVTDIVYLSNAILGSPAVDYVAEAADVNTDGNITVTDIVALCNIILGN